MKIAVLGAGFSGLATAWHLLNSPAYRQSKTRLILIDPMGIGGGASGAAAGLLHPYAGLHAKLNMRGLEGHAAAKNLLEISSQALDEPVYEASGVLRLALTESQIKSYTASADRYPDVEWLSAKATSAMISGIAIAPAIFIKSGITVYTEKYLQGLWAACSKLGAVFERKAVRSLRELEDFNVIVAALGASTKTIPELSSLPINCVKGQIIELEWPEHCAPLPCAINSQVYCVMHPNRRTCFAGSTFERQYSTQEPCLKKAESDIRPKLAELFPALADAQILSCRAGIRATTPDHLPLIRQMSDRFWVITGMGSKGLLYHALYAQELAEQICEHKLD